MEMNGGSTASCLARAPCVPSGYACFNRSGNKRAFKLSGATRGRTVGPSPGHIRRRALPSSGLKRLAQKNPRAHKNKIGTPPPPKPKNTPPPPQNEEFYGHVFFLQKERIFPGAHKIDAPISGPRIADKNFTDTRIFLISLDRKVSDLLRTCIACSGPLLSLLRTCMIALGILATSWASFRDEEPPRGSLSAVHAAQGHRDAESMQQ